MRITDAGTGFLEVSITPDRKLETVIRMFETTWVCQHGAPAAASGVDEYNRSLLSKYFPSHSITFNPRPTRRNYKTVIVEKKNGTIKAILAKLDDENSTANADTLVS
eukprot:gb/GEZJ01003740.1/.p4 GENE.gb/GEZJ01003740.1/~~gb/GEZJ01003740.1/.p4  ORF type:complete len:107 (-),score=6.19 gb/GEZJ01003740.1/:3388-3708(-)